MKRTAIALTLMLTILLSGVGWGFHSARGNFMPAEPPAGILITSEGSINGTNRIKGDGGFFTFTDNVNEPIVVLRDNVVIDGAGYSLIGQRTSSGVFLQGVNNVTVKNLNIVNFTIGVSITWRYLGEESGGHNISGNIFLNNTVGISLGMCTSGNFISNNTIIYGSNGISIWYSSSNVLRNNHMVCNDYNIWVDDYLSNPTSRFTNDIDTSNTVDGKPVYYWVGEHGNTVPADAGFIGLISCRDIVVETLTLTHNSHGVFLKDSSNCTIRNNRMINNDEAIAIHGEDNNLSRNNIVIDNELIQNAEAGIVTSDNVQGEISRNYIANNQFTGITAYGFHDSCIVGNNITKNGDDGIELFDSQRCLVLGNYIAQNGRGELLRGRGIEFGYDCNGCNITNNVIAENTNYAVYIDGSSGILIHHNSFINNAPNESKQAKVYGLFSTPWNRWHEYSEGNYWSDHHGSDPYVIDVNNFDAFPLASPIEMPKVPSASNLAIPTQTIPSSIPQLTLTQNGSEPFSSNLVFTLTVSTAFVSISLLIYFKKRKHVDAKQVK